VARQVERILERQKLATNISRQTIPTHKFFSTGSPENLQNLVEKLTGQQIETPQVIDLSPTVVSLKNYFN
jgi:glutamate racemase